MSFDGAILTAAFTRAVTSIPPALVAIRSLISRGEKKDVLDQLDQLGDHLVSLADVNHWLDEAKRLHELIQHIQPLAEQANSYYRAAYRDGIYNFQDYRIDKVVDAWQILQQNSFPQLLVFAEGLRRIEKEPLVRDESAKFVSGPLWTKRLIEHVTQVRHSFEKFFKNPDSNKAIKVGEGIGELVEFLTELSADVDNRIRREATAMGEALGQLAASVRTQ